MVPCLKSLCDEQVLKQHINLDTEMQEKKMLHWEIEEVTFIKKYRMELSLIGDV